MQKENENNQSSFFARRWSALLLAAILPLTLSLLVEGIRFRMTAGARINNLEAEVHYMRNERDKFIKRLLTQEVRIRVLELSARLTPTEE